MLFRSKIEEILHIFIKILKGVAEAHAKNILHRDLKPSNILIEGLDNAKVIDFGLSKILGIKYRNNTKTLKDYMTAAYASPEQLARKELTVQSDIFSVGAILLYMLTKVDPPIEKERISERVDDIQCSSNLKSILKNSLNPELNKRFNSIYELIREVNQEYINLYSKTKTFYLSNRIGGQFTGTGRL